MADNDESDDDKHRRQRIKDVLDNLRNRKHKKKKQLSATMPQRKGVKAGSAAESTTKCGRSGRHKECKIHFGWLHYNKGSYKQVKFKQGGGTRILPYASEESQTVESLLLLGKKVFFPEGRSQCGLLSEMDVRLSQFDGKVISEFRDINGKECCFQEFLKSNGLYSSQFYLYIMTKKKKCEQKTDINGNVESEPISETKSVGEPSCNSNTELAMNTEHESQTEGNETGILLVNNQVPQKVFVKYTRDTISSYSGQLSSLSFHSMLDCEEFSGHSTQKDYTPLEDGFTVTSITVGDKLYSYKELNGLYKFPQREQGSANFLLHRPNEICGTEDNGSLIIGVVTNVPNSGEGIITWYKSGQIFAAGIYLCLIRITEPGEYNMTVHYKDCIYTLDTPVVVSRARNDQTIEHQVATGLVNDQTIEHQVATGLVNDQTIGHQVATGLVNDQTIEHQVATGLVNDQTIGHQVATGLVNGQTIEHQVATGYVNDQTIGHQVTIGYVNDQTIRHQVATGSVNDQTIGPQIATGYVNDQTSEHQIATEYVNDQTIEHQIATGYVNDQPIEHQIATGYVNDQTSEHQIATESVNDQTIEHQIATGYVNDQTIEYQIATGSVNDQTFGHQVATGSVNDQTIEHQIATGSVTGQIIENQVATETVSEQFETLFNSAIIKLVNDPAVDLEFERGKNETTAKAKTNMPGRKSRKSLNSTDNSVIEQPPIKKKCNTLEDSISNLHIKYGDFSIFEKIGEGGFGEVYQGEYLGTDVAVKKLKVKRMKLVKQSVLQEVEINSHIRHPNIVLLMGYSIQADCLYILTEFISGPNLDDVLFGDAVYPILSLPQKRLIALQVCQATSYLHNRNPAIIHRDIKPENILLTKNFEIAKICDMGLSKLKAMNTLNTTIANKREMQPGTPAYQAPEILLNCRTAKMPSDIWSLCCTVVELYTEKTVWNIDHACSVYDEGNCSVQIIINCMERKEDPHGLFHLETVAYISSEIRTIIREGLQYDMSKRPSALDVCKVFS